MGDCGKSVRSRFRASGIGGRYGGSPIFLNRADGDLVVGGQLVVLGCVGVGSDLGSVVVGCVLDAAVALAVGPRSVGVVVAGARCCGVGVCGGRWRRRL